MNYAYALFFVVEILVVSYNILPYLMGVGQVCCVCLFK